MQRYPILSVIFERFGALLVTVAGVLLLVAVRLSGNAVASFFEHSFGLISKSLGQAAGNKIRTFHAGLDVIHSFSDFAITASISLSMWVLIALAYLETIHAFTASPSLGRDELFKMRSADDDQRRRERRCSFRSWDGFRRSPLWLRRSPACSAQRPKPPPRAQRPFCSARSSASLP